MNLSHEKRALQFVIKRFYKDDKNRIFAHDVTLDIWKIDIHIYLDKFSNDVNFDKM